MIVHLLSQLDEIYMCKQLKLLMGILLIKCITKKKLQKTRFLSWRLIGRRLGITHHNQLRISLDFFLSNPPYTKVCLWRPRQKH